VFWQTRGHGDRNYHLRVQLGINLVLDELIAQVEVDIRNSPLTAYRLGRIKSTANSVEIDSNSQ
jgi:hypothetical protein